MRGCAGFLEFPGVGFDVVRWFSDCLVELCSGCCSGFWVWVLWRIGVTLGEVWVLHMVSVVLVVVPLSFVCEFRIV